MPFESAMDPKVIESDSDNVKLIFALSNGSTTGPDLVRPLGNKSAPMFALHNATNNKPQCKELLVVTVKSDVKRSGNNDNKPTRDAEETDVGESNQAMDLVNNALPKCKWSSDSTGESKCKLLLDDEAVPMCKLPHTSEDDLKRTTLQMASTRLIWAKGRGNDKLSAWARSETRAIDLEHVNRNVNDANSNWLVLRKAIVAPMCP